MRENQVPPMWFGKYPIRDGFDSIIRADSVRVGDLRKRNRQKSANLRPVRVRYGSTHKGMPLPKESIHILCDNLPVVIV